MPVSWDYFVRRNKINVESFLKKHKCKSYEDLGKLLNQDDIILPDRSEVSKYFPPPPKPPRKPPVNRRQRLGIKKKPAAPKPKQTVKKEEKLEKPEKKEVKNVSKQAD